MPLIKGVFYLITVLSVPMVVQAVDLELYWDHSTTNEDGTPLSNRGGYKLYYGLGAGAYSTSVDAKDVTQFKITGLSLGTTYFFAATTYNLAGDESGYSNELRVDIPALPPPAGDSDGDGVEDATDNCVDQANPDQSDGDSDGLGDLCDPNPNQPNRASARLDFDGDGISDFGVRLQAKRGSALTYRIIYSSDQSSNEIIHGNAGDIDAHGDYNGDGRYDLTVVRRSGGALEWIVRDSATGNSSSELFGKPGEQVLSGCDFDGDYISDKAVLKNRALLIKRSFNAEVSKLTLPKAFRSVSCGDLNQLRGDEVLVVGTKRTRAKRSNHRSKTELRVIDLQGQTLYKRVATRALAVFAADLNGDGLRELAYSTSKGRQLRLNFLIGSETVPLEVPKGTLTPVRLKASDNATYDGLFLSTPSKRSLQINFRDLVIEELTLSVKGSSILRSPAISVGKRSKKK